MSLKFTADQILFPGSRVQGPGSGASFLLCLVLAHIFELSFFFLEKSCNHYSLNKVAFVIGLWGLIPSLFSL